MAAVANLTAENLVVQPGQSVTADLSLVNTGTIVEQFTILLLGDVAAWTEVSPPVVSLFPQGQQTVTIRFSPPRHHTTPNGEVPFAVKVIPSNAPEESVVEEGVLTIGLFNDVGAELVPRVATGRISGKQKLAVDSRGNVPIPVELSAFDAADGLKFAIKPSHVVAAPGEARFARVKVKPKQHFWRGSPQQKPYKVQVAPEGEKPLVLDGSLTQKALLPKWLIPLLAILALLVLFWFFVLRPIVKSTAVTANAAALAAQAADTKRLNAALAATKASVAALNKATPPTTAKAGGGAPPPAATTTVPGTSTTATTAGSTTTAGATTTTAPKNPTLPNITGPYEFVVDSGVVAPNGTNAPAAPFLGVLSPAVPTGGTFNLTDIILQVESGTDGTVIVHKSNPDEHLLFDPLGTLTGSASELRQTPVGGEAQYHFNTPIRLDAGQTVSLSLACGANSLPCQVQALFVGSETKPGS